MKTINVSEVEALSGELFSCVYRLIGDDGLVVYVGQTCNLFQRIHWHIKYGKSFHSVAYEEVGSVHLNNVEAATIVRTKAKLNKTLPANDFYKSKAALKRSLVGLVDELISGLQTDFEIEKCGVGRLGKDYIATWKMLLIKDAVKDAISDTLPVMNEEGL